MTFFTEVYMDIWPCIGVKTLNKIWKKCIFDRPVSLYLSLSPHLWVYLYLFIKRWMSLFVMCIRAITWVSLNQVPSFFPFFMPLHIPYMDCHDFMRLHSSSIFITTSTLTSHHITNWNRCRVNEISTWRWNISPQTWQPFSIF